MSSFVTPRPRHLRTSPAVTWTRRKRKLTSGSVGTTTGCCCCCCCQRPVGPCGRTPGAAVQVAKVATSASHHWRRSALTLLVLCSVFCSLLVTCGGKGLGSDDEEQLVRTIFRGYNKLIRPVKNLTEVVTVQFGMALIQLINVDERNQILKSNVWLRLVWTDYQLEWDPADYGGINSIRVPSDKVWIPDIVLFNNADGKYEVSYKSNVVLYNTGACMWIPPAIYKSSCTIDVEFFPFDQQRCTMKFGSWTFNANQVQLSWYEGLNKIDLNDYVFSGTWDIIDVPAKMSDDMSTITYDLLMRRKTLFYTVNLIVPTVLISFLSILVFYLPTDAGEKMTLGISILLALVVFLLLVSKILPPTSITIPLVAKYLLFAFIMNIVTILVTVVIINWNFRGPTTHRMKSWVRLVFLRILPKILLMKRPVPPWRKRRQRTMKTSGPSAVGSPRHGGFPGPPDGSCGNACGNSVGARTGTGEMLELRELHHPNCPTRQRAQRRNPSPPDNEDTTAFHLTPEMHRCAEAVQFIAEHLCDEDETARIQEDWKYVAMVIDRLQLYLFFAVTVGGTFGLIMNAPHIFEYVDQFERIEALTGKSMQ